MLSRLILVLLFGLALAPSIAQGLPNPRDCGQNTTTTKKSSKKDASLAKDNGSSVLRQTYSIVFTALNAKGITTATTTLRLPTVSISATFRKLNSRISRTGSPRTLPKLQAGWP